VSHDIEVAHADIRQDLELIEVAAAVRASVGMLMRRMRQVPAPGDLSVPESSALSKLDRGGPTTAGALARQEQISPQSMGTTLAGLEARGLVERRADPADGRRVVLSATEAGRQALADKRSARTELLAGALSAGFTRAELRQLMTAAPLLERLAERI
jgi:DNA-binding MarR family transcriptional regulator